MSHTASPTPQCCCFPEFYGDAQGVSYYSVAVVPQAFCKQGVTFADLKVRLPLGPSVHCRSPPAAHVGCCNAAATLLLLLLLLRCGFTLFALTPPALRRGRSRATPATAAPRVGRCLSDTLLRLEW